VSDEERDPTDAEIAKRRDDVVRRMLATPPRPKPPTPAQAKRARKAT
jgi:hypothetical protein